jgi:hypothetical protein
MSPASENPLFRRLAVLAGFLAASSAATWIVAALAGHHSAPDGVVSLCYLTGLAVALVFLLRGKEGRPLLRTTLLISGSLVLFLFVWLASRGLGMSYGPDDCLFLFIIPGSIVGTVAAVIDDKANLRALFSLKFLQVVRGSLLPLTIYWAVIAFIGSRIVAWLFNPYFFELDLSSLRVPEGLNKTISAKVVPLLESVNLRGEEEWFQISLVLVASALTLLTWHRTWHRPDRLVETFDPEPDSLTHPLN